MLLINVLPRLTFHQAAEGYRDWRAGVPTLGDNAAGVEEAVVTLVGPLSMAVVVTRSHRGHIDRVDAGSGSQLWGEITVGGPTFIALSSSTSLCSLLFCSVNEPNHLFKYSHSISVCFSLLLLIKLNHINNYDRSSTELYSISKEPLMLPVPPLIGAFLLAVKKAVVSQSILVINAYFLT